MWEVHAIAVAKPDIMVETQSAQPRVKPAENVKAETTSPVYVYHTQTTGEKKRSQLKTKPTSVQLMQPTVNTHLQSTAALNQH